MHKSIPKYDVDIFSRESVINANAVDDALRESSPVVKLPGEDVIMLARFEHVSAGLGDWRTYSSTSRPWHDPNSCWFNSLYSRVVPSHAIQLTSALLDRRVASAVGPRRSGRVTLQQKQNLAAVIHLCGATAGRAYVTRGFRLSSHQRCGGHDVRDYLARVKAMKQQFARLAAAA